MLEWHTLPEELCHSTDVGSNVYSTPPVCKERGMLHNELIISAHHPS